ncbi:MAG: hypothetical protein M1370_00525 [Bacteroidetes bacterium]|nr:hypothetical protein [Bacteroidota bacterium]MCL5025242.1 hypothetical protein [Chloroflexota bacterium]
MVTSNRDTRDTGVAPATYARPVAALMKALGRITAPYPGASFRSTLLRTQQRYLATPSKSPVQSKLTALEGLSFISPGVESWLLRPDAIYAAMLPALVGSSVGHTGTRPLLNPAAQVDAPAGVSHTGAAAIASAAVPPSAPPAVSSTPPVMAPTARSSAMPLAAFPRPEGDNGRGMHWVPTMSSSNAAVDRFVKEARDMKVKWMVILNDGTKTGANDYLVKQLVANGIMPIMRIYTPNGRPIEGDLGALVRHYRELGVSYYQLYNEPNLKDENPNGVPSVDSYLDKWIPAAQMVTAAGGLPGLGSLSPGGSFDDIEFLKQVLDKIKQRGEVATLDKAWLGMHNYTFNHPLDYAKDSNGFMKFKWYDAIVREKLGREMPIIGTEGGTYVGSGDDKMFPRVDEAKQVDMVTGAYQYMKSREPYNFAYTYWVIANEEGGGTDPAFSHQALFKRTGPSPLVDALKKLD